LTFFYPHQGGNVFIGVSKLFSFCLFVNKKVKQGCAKSTQSVITKFGGKVARGTRMKSLDFGGNPDVMVMSRVYGCGYG